MNAAALNRVLDTIRMPRVKNFMMFVIGLGFAVLLFHRPQKTWDMLAMSLTELDDKVIKQDGKCYRYKVEDATCPKDS
jgi:hypothetical protein